MFKRFVVIFLFCLGALMYAAGPVLAEEAGAAHEAGAVAAEAAHGEAAHEAAGHGGGEHGEHHALTHGQVMNFVWHCLNFALLLVILVKFLKQPITDSLKGRQESIAKAFEELEAKKAEAADRFKEYEQKLSGMDEEAKRILENFIAQGQKERDSIIEQAKAAAERIKAQAEFYVQQELAKAKTELQREVADMAVKMAEEIIRKNLTEQDQSKLISEYLERVVQKN
ncbi:MAG: F0F1 ATP synthase subunit B [Thermodesulfobacteria bacterium]|nr:F0F1 ATP synthase subunit B [Thermodesulfobacteriota bacterium]